MQAEDRKPHVCFSSREKGAGVFFWRGLKLQVKRSRGSLDIHISISTSGYGLENWNIFNKISSLNSISLVILSLLQPFCLPRVVNQFPKFVLKGKVRMRVKSCIHSCVNRTEPRPTDLNLPSIIKCTLSFHSVVSGAFQANSREGNRSPFQWPTQVDGCWSSGMK